MTEPMTLTDIINDMAAIYLNMRAGKLDPKEGVRKIRELNRNAMEIRRQGNRPWLRN